MKIKISIVLSVILAISLAETEQTSFRRFAEGNVEFTAQVFEELLNTNEGNFIISPLSAHMVLALVQAGAKGHTLQEITKYTHLPELDQTEAAVRSFSSKLKSSNQNVTLKLANALFAGETFDIKETFTKTAVDTFDAAIDKLDFRQTATATQKINQWIAEKTQNEITNMLTPDALDANTKLVSVNALHFMAQWKLPFDEINTKKENFFIDGENSVKVDMMNAAGFYRYQERNGMKYLEIPFVGSTVSMTIVLPNEVEGLKNAQFDVESLLNVAELSEEKVLVSLPRWTSESQTDFTKLLTKLGVRTLFGAEADLTGISDDGLYISKVFQKAFINVTESGTQASVATAVVLPGAVSPVIPEMVFKADHPFMYFIRDVESGIVYFAGRYSP